MFDLDITPKTRPDFFYCYIESMRRLVYGYQVFDLYEGYLTTRWPGQFGIGIR